MYVTHQSKVVIGMGSGNLQVFAQVHVWVWIPVSMSFKTSLKSSKTVKY